MQGGLAILAVGKNIFFDGKSQQMHERRLLG